MHHYNRTQRKMDDINSGLRDEASWYEYDINVSKKNFPETFGVHPRGAELESELHGVVATSQESESEPESIKPPRL